MTQQVLARKWRPTSFQDLIGQDHVRKALTHALTSKRLHHAYLFTGTRGVGKTTIARILARCLNCDTGVTATPCGQCGACQAISEGRFVDLIEVDAASRTKVDDTRDLLENVSYAPTSGRYKIYLIDEVHMLTSQSFNALLKTLEEPPEHVVFLFATTDPHKLLPTVLSRCLQFHLRDLSADQIQGHLRHVVDAEGITADAEALWQLARAGRGSMRDAMTLLDQAIAFGEGAVITGDVVEMLGVQGLSEIPALLRDIAENHADAALDRIRQLALQTPDWLALVSGMQTVLHQVAVSQISANALTHLPPSEQQAVNELAALMAPEFLQLAYQFTLTGYRDMPMASDPRSAFEMLILRILAFRPAGPGESISAARMPATTSDAEPSDPEPGPQPKLTPKIDSDASPLARVADVDPEPPESIAFVAMDSEQTSDADAGYLGVDASSAAEPHFEPEPEPTSDQVEPSQAVVHQSVSAGVEIDTSVQSGEPDDEDIDDPLASVVAHHFVPETWVTDVKVLGLHGMTGSLIMQSVLLDIDGSVVRLAMRESTSRLMNDTHRKRIAEAFAVHLGQVPEIQIETRDSLTETPEAYLVRMRQEALKRAQERFQKDPFVATLTEELGAEVRIETIQPRENDHV